MFKVAIFIIIGTALALSDNDPAALNPRSLSLQVQNQISGRLDQQIRAQFWYYLQGSELIRQLRSNDRDRLIFQNYYQNIAGTFLVVASWYPGLHQSRINTVIRIGRGSQTAAHTEQDSKLLPLDDTKVNIETLRKTEEQCQNLSLEYLKYKYWEYIAGAELIFSIDIQKNSLLYNMKVYLGRIGTFLAITNCEGGVIGVKTFVRVGAGSQSASIKRIFSEPAIVQIFSG